MLLFVTSPLISTPNLLRTLMDFGSLSGLTVNLSKSMALNISVPDNRVNQLKQHFPFPWAKDSISYLGIILPSKVDRLFAANYPQIFKKLKECLGAWSKFGLFWLSRVNAVKMTLMLRILYLFRSLPIPTPKHILTKFQLRIIHFIWGKKIH